MNGSKQQIGGVTELTYIVIHTLPRGISIRSDRHVGPSIILSGRINYRMISNPGPSITVDAALSLSLSHMDMPYIL